VEEDTPFFVWVSTTRMHIWTRLKEGALGRTGVGVYPDGMVEHDDQVGGLLDLLEELGIDDNTIVVYSTDNGVEKVSWPDGGIAPWHGEKGTTWEGGFRVPQFIRWPGVIEPGTKYNNIISHEDWLPTFLAAAGDPSIVEKLKKGHKANGKDWKVHLDGYNFMPFFKGEVKESPREEILYFGQGGELNAVRWKEWKVHFAIIEGNIATGERVVTNWPTIINLWADPYEEMHEEGDLGYLRWYADNMWLFVPIQDQMRKFFVTLPDYPFQEGSSLSAAGINYNSLNAMKALKMLEELEHRLPVGH